jgi:predicted Zn finger-like uncharacterized protein
MRIACPTCAAAYDVPDAMLASGPRLLRCARCGNQFTGALPGPEAAPEPRPEPPSPAPPSSEAAAPEPAPPEPGPASESPPDSVPGPPTGPEPEAPERVVPRDRPAPTRGLPRHSPIEEQPEPAESPPPSTRKLTAAWLLSLALLGAGGYALLHYHAEIAAAWPPAARLYLALGLG